MADPETDKQVVNVPITKAKSTVAVTIDDIPPEAWAEVVLQGLKVVLNRGMSKISKAELGDEDTVKKEAQTKGDANLTDLYAGKVRITGGAKKSGLTGAVKTEAMRLARNLIKDEIKRAGLKVSHIEAAEITKAARAYLDSSPELIEQAKANLEARAKVPVAAKIDIKALVKEDPKLVAKAEARKKDKGLSAKQAGMVQARSKPQATATH